MTDEMTKNSPQPNADSAAATALPWLTATLLFWPIAIVGAALDLWSKWAVFKWLEGIPDRHIEADPDHAGDQRQGQRRINRETARLPAPEITKRLTLQLFGPSLG